MAKPSKILSIDFKFVPLGLSRAETIKVDVNLNEHKSLYPVVGVSFQSLNEDGDLVSAQTLSYDINEMMGTKTRALLQRKQGRDLYDLWHAWDQSSAGATRYEVDGRKAMQAFEWYLANENTAIGQAEANQLLAARLRSGDFRRDMDTLLRPGLPKFDVDAAALVVRREYFAHLSAS